MIPKGGIKFIYNAGREKRRYKVQSNTNKEEEKEK
jgi:hypothetical protein